MGEDIGDTEDLVDIITEFGFVGVEDTRRQAATPNSWH
jgi:hypothetical protein